MIRGPHEFLIISLQKITLNFGYIFFFFYKSEVEIRVPAALKLKIRPLMPLTKGLIFYTITLCAHAHAHVHAHGSACPHATQSIIGFS